MTTRRQQLGSAWRRRSYPTGVPYYVRQDAPDVTIEARVNTSSHVGMVFGNFVNEAGRESKVAGWRVRIGNRNVGPEYRTLAQAKAAAERRIEAR